MKNSSYVTKQINFHKEKICMTTEDDIIKTIEELNWRLMRFYSFTPIKIRVFLL